MEKLFDGGVKAYRDGDIPYFCWDRPWTVGDIKNRLRTEDHDEWMRTAAWIMREARFSEVWLFLSPGQVFESLPELKRYLKPKTEFWEYIMRTWHELGRV